VRIKAMIVAIRFGFLPLFALAHDDCGVPSTDQWSVAATGHSPARDIIDLRVTVTLPSRAFASRVAACPYRPDVTWPQWRLWVGDLALVPHRARPGRVAVVHGQSPSLRDTHHAITTTQPT
jgi:hypothetical protein